MSSEGYKPKLNQMRPGSMADKINKDIEEELAKQRANAPDIHKKKCHWCEPGYMKSTPTSGRLECDYCMAISLIGRYA